MGKDSKKNNNPQQVVESKQKEKNQFMYCLIIKSFKIVEFDNMTVTIRIILDESG